MSTETMLQRSEQALEVRLDDETLLRDLRELRGLVARLLVSGHGTVSVDIGSVARLSSATVAVLLWAKRSCLSHGVEMRVRNPSSRNLDVMRRCGMLEVLDRTTAVEGEARLP
jgi:anti-anti-sigma factor